MTEAVSLTDAVVRFDSVRALDGVSITVGSDEVVSLVGPSGCGKSTLLRTLAGLVTLDHGTLRLGGNLVDDSRHHQPPEKRHIGLVFQEHSLFPHLTVNDNVAFGIRDTSRDDVSTRVAEALEVVGLSGYGERYPHELSGGERQRVTLARALAPRPTLLLFDEPFASLDPNLRHQLRRHVMSVLDTTKTPAVFVTHDQTEALSIGDRVAVMKAGQIKQIAAPSDIFHRPIDRFVAAFMGEASFLSIDLNGTTATTAVGPVASSSVPTGATAMVRPDDLDFTRSPTGNATLIDAEFRGMIWSCTVALDSGETLVVNRSHTDPPTPGARGTVALRPGHSAVVVAPE